MKEPTSTQQAALKRLEQTAGARRRYTSEDRGSSIVRQFRLYLESEDASKIGHAMYRYLTLKIPFVIAHFGLVAPDGGFRTYYQEPARLLADILPHKQELEDRIARGDPDTVYSDGEDDLTVTRQVLAMAEEHLDGVLRKGLQRGRARDLADAEVLAARHGYVLAPTGDPGEPGGIAP
jgi:hypothetical protein